MYGADRFHTFSTWAVGPSHPAFKWKVAMSPPKEPSIGPDGTIYVYEHARYMLTAVSPNGVVLWSQPATSGAAVSDDGYLYVAYDNYSTRCYRPDGSAAWDYYWGWYQRPCVLASDGNIWTSCGRLTEVPQSTGPKLGF